MLDTVISNTFMSGLVARRESGSQKITKILFGERISHDNKKKRKEKQRKNL